MFGKRTQVTGFYSKECSEHNYHVGDSELKLKQFEIIKTAIDQNQLVDRVNSIGQQLSTAVQNAVKKSDRLKFSGASGTQIWIDTKTHEDAVALQTFLRKNGVLVQVNAFGVVAKPALTLDN